MPSRILALDYGTKRIGVALSDELGWTAQPLETFERRTLDRDIAHIASWSGRMRSSKSCWVSPFNWMDARVRRSKRCASSRLG